MTQISDERLNELIALNIHALERVGGVMRGHDAYKQEYLDTVKALKELLSLRSQNKRLVEDGERLAKAIAMDDTKTEKDVERLDSHAALLAELDGKG